MNYRGFQNFQFFLSLQTEAQVSRTHKIKNREELDFFLKYEKSPIVQEYIEGQNIQLMHI